MLLFRPKIQKDECLVSYLIRVSEHNGFKHIGYLLHHAGLDWKNLHAPVHQILTGEFDLSGYLAVLGLSGRKPETAARYQTFKRIIDTSYIFVKYPKVCPVCLAEKGYCLSKWVYLPVLVCSKHNVLLVDVQKQTGTRLSWYRQKLDRFQSNSGAIEVDESPMDSSMLEFSNYFELLAVNANVNPATPAILCGLDFREALTLLNFLAHYQARLAGKAFKPVSMEAHLLALRYLAAWKIIQDWPHSFYSMLSQYIEHPMSSTGVTGINKHYRDLYECLHRQQGNQGIARIKMAFDRYIQAYWPGLVESARITRINLSSPTRSILSKKEAAKLLDCRPERIDKLVQLERLSLIDFKGQSHYLREEVMRLANMIAANWSMDEACEALQVTRYQLKQLLEAEISLVIQKPDKLNRGWLINRAQCEALVASLRQKVRKGSSPDNTVSMAGVQRQGFTIVRLISAMQSGQVEYGVCAETEHPDSLKQFIEFKIHKSAGIKSST
ncbi:MAG: TniQ family protein [Colwellia sp.]